MFNFVIVVVRCHVAVVAVVVVVFVVLLQLLTHSLKCTYDIC